MFDLRAHYSFERRFMCSFVPDKRSDWADTWGRLIKPGGELITLIFPVGLGEFFMLLSKLFVNCPAHLRLSI